MVCFSAPCRLDVGGSWDMPPFALLSPHTVPTTVTMALDMRVKVGVEVTHDNNIVLNINNIESVYNSLDHVRFGVDNFVLTILSHFNLTSNIRVGVYNEFPLQSGLGGSGALVVCLIRCVQELFGKKDHWSIVQLAHMIENACGVYTGLQDQCAAMSGGIYQWFWDYRTTTWFKQHSLFVDFEEFSKRLVVIYTGQQHFSSDVNNLQITSFYDPSTRFNWLDINKNTFKYAEALRSKDWLRACKAISTENLIRTNLVAERCSPLAKKLQDAVIDLPCGFGIAGAGKGGCVFILGESVEVTEEIRIRCIDILSSVPGAKFLCSHIAVQGLKGDLL